MALNRMKLMLTNYVMKLKLVMMTVRVIFKLYQIIQAVSSIVLHLVVRDGLNECGSHLRQIITKASSTVNYVRKSLNASEFLEDQKWLQASNATRWNSQFYILNSILSVSEDKLDSLECSVKLTEYE